MFQSYKYKKPMFSKDDKYCWEYELTDSEFGTVLGVGFLEVFFDDMFEIAVIQEYSKRNLNVAANLALAFVWWQKQHPWQTIRDMLDTNKEFNPLFPQYEEDLQKYLLLL
jgi:hypothetical protein